MVNPTTFLIRYRSSACVIHHQPCDYHVFVRYRNERNRSRWWCLLPYLSIPWPRIRWVNWHRVLSGLCVQHWYECCGTGRLLHPELWNTVWRLGQLPPGRLLVAVPLGNRHSGVLHCYLPGGKLYICQGKQWPLGHIVGGHFQYSTFSDFLEAFPGSSSGRGVHRTPPENIDGKSQAPSHQRSRRKSDQRARKFPRSIWNSVSGHRRHFCVSCRHFAMREVN